MRNELSNNECRIELYSAIAALDKVLTWKKLDAGLRQRLADLVNGIERELQSFPKETEV